MWPKFGSRTLRCRTHCFTGAVATLHAAVCYVLICGLVRDGWQHHVVIWVDGGGGEGGERASMGDASPSSLDRLRTQA